MDAALEAHLGGPPLLGFAHPVGDLAQLEQVGRAPEVEREGAFGEGAELALEGADVGVVDVPVGHVGDLVTHRLAPELVGHIGHGPDLGAPGREQGDDLVLAHGLAELDPGQHVAHRAAGGAASVTTGGDGAGADRPGDHRRASGTERAGGGGVSPPEHQGWSRPSPSASEASSTGKRIGLGQPAVGVESELGVEGQPGRQREPGRLGGVAQDRESGPGPLGIDVVGGDRARRRPSRRCPRR